MMSRLISPFGMFYFHGLDLPDLAVFTVDVVGGIVVVDEDDSEEGGT